MFASTSERATGARQPASPPSSLKKHDRLRKTPPRSGTTPEGDRSHQKSALLEAQVDAFPESRPDEGQMALEGIQADDHSVILRVDNDILIQQSHVGTLTYVTGALTDLKVSQLNGLTRALSSMIADHLQISKGDINAKTGLLMSDDRLSLAAQFSVCESHRQTATQERLIEIIKLSSALLGDQNLWDYSKPTTDDPAEIEAWRMVEAARKARQEIPCRKLPFSCSLATGRSEDVVRIGAQLARAKPKKTVEQQSEAIGVLTGYCTEERIIKFKAQKSTTGMRIGFDEELFLDRIFSFCGRDPQVVHVSWTTSVVDGVVSHRTLRDFSSAIAPLETSP